MEKTIKLTSISADEFELLADKTRMHPATRELARLVLVEGKSGTEVAAMFKKSKQFVGKAVRVIRQAHAASTPSGSAWVTLNLAIPGAMNVALQQFLERLRICPSIQANELGMAQVIRALERATELLKLVDEHDSQ